MKTRALAAAICIALLILAVKQLEPTPAPAWKSSVAEFARITQNEALWDNQWRDHDGKIDALAEELSRTTHWADRIDLQRRITEQQLYAGHNEAAIAGLRALLEQLPPKVPKAYRLILKKDLALAYLRLGEQQNCLWNQSASRCSFPFDEQAVHQQKLGAQQAAEIYLELLADPDLKSREQAEFKWLFNLSHMALGDYPQGVPEQWRLNEKLFADQTSSPRFRDIAAQAGVDTWGTSGGSIMDDFNGDGQLDILDSAWGYEETLRLYLNQGNSQFIDASDRSGLSKIPGGLNINQADYDNDGDLDIFVLRGAWLHEKGQHPNSLLENDGHGNFHDVTDASGLLSYYPSQTAAWADINGDGRLDLFIGNEVLKDKRPWPADAKHFELYLNLGADENGHVRFREIGPDSGIQVQGMIKGSAWGDINNDGLPDLYVSIWGRPNHLFLNQGDGKFRDISAQAGVQEPLASFPCWFWDFDNDGQLDIFVSGYQAQLSDISDAYLGKTHYGETPRLYRNLGDLKFEEISTHGLNHPLLSMGSNFADWNNDGWEDLLVGTGAPALDTLMPNRAFLNQGGTSFAEVTSGSGLGHLQKGHGISFGDIDKDGDLDIYAVIGGAYESDAFWNALYENPGNENGSLQIRLHGQKSNYYGVGARLRTQLSNGRKIYRWISSGSSFGGNPLLAHVGLRPDERIKDIEVCWPGAECQLYSWPMEQSRQTGFVDLYQNGQSS